MSVAHPDDTIAALSTPLGEGGIAVIRVSGSDAIRLVSRFFRSGRAKNLMASDSHRIHHGRWVDEKEEMVDEVLVSVFRAPHSYTGEDVVEVSCHGGIRLTRKILEIFFRNGARPAEPGEFTKRAFLHGKLDLTQVEAVLDLIRARSDASLEASVHQLEGALSKKIQHLKDLLLKVTAHWEAAIDFPDERLDVASRAESLNWLAEVEREIELLIATFRRGSRLREGVLTVIVGRPNVGKSSLLNILLGRDRALVSALPGTTRDALEEELEIGGVGLRLVDTAGLKEGAPDPLEQMGIERTRQYLCQGDLFLWVLDGSSEWSPEDEALRREMEGKEFLLVVNKIDLPQKLNRDQLYLLSNGKKPCFVSCLEEKGIEELEKKIGESLAALEISPESITLTRLRHKLALEKSLAALREVRREIRENLSPELVSIDLKNAIDSLSELIGEIYSEDLLDVIFKEFCIGK